MHTHYYYCESYMYCNIWKWHNYFPFSDMLILLPWLASYIIIQLKHVESSYFSYKPE